MALPSDITRHHALSVTTTDRREADFDFLSQPLGYRRQLIPFKWVFRISIFIVLVSLLILVIVDVTKVECNSNDQDSFDAIPCFYMIGGGKIREGSSIITGELLSLSCLGFYKKYFEKDGGLYWDDTERAIKDGRLLLKKQNVEYSKMVVFDIDETALSNLRLYQDTDFDPQQEDLAAWFSTSHTDVIPATRDFYKELRERGYSVAFITGRNNGSRESTMETLEIAGYGKQCQTDSPDKGEICYVRLVMRETDDDRDAMVYKSEERKKLVDDGFEMVAGVGDQWSDLLGTDRPPTIIKMPNPLYFIP